MTAMEMYAAALKKRADAQVDLEAAEKSVRATEPNYVTNARFNFVLWEKSELDSIDRFAKALKGATDLELRIYNLYRKTLCDKHFFDLAKEELKLAIAKSIEEANCAKGA